MTPVDPALLPATGFRPGSLRGAEGFYRAAQDEAGHWWLLDPAGHAFFARAVQGVARGSDPAAVAGEDPAVRLWRWGFNAVGAGGDGTGREDGLPYFGSVDFCRAGVPIVARGLRLPDVFAPDWPRLAAERALEVCTSHAAATELIGWITDEAAGWAQHRAPARPSLLQLCLSLEPGFATYHAAWEFVLALHGGRIESLARAWGVPLANKEVVRELTRGEKALATRGYHRDEVRWTRELARRYFATTAAAIRAADPHHLVLGCRFNGPVGAAVLAEATFPVLDAAMPDWSELPPVNAVGPVIAGNVDWTGEAFWQAPLAPNARPAGAAGTMIGVTKARTLTSVERMLCRGRAALERTARHPAVTGYVWRQWQDEPGEQPPFAKGLVHLNGTEAREHTELLAQINRRADSLHGSPRRTSSP